MHWSFNAVATYFLWSNFSDLFPKVQLLCRYKPHCFLIFVILMDFFVVAILINRSFEMFASTLGDMAAICRNFASTYLAGSSITASSERKHYEMKDNQITLFGLTSKRSLLIRRISSLIPGIYPL
jgi:hypothetical protein